ncbi:hypothetical protein EDD36DRAFT_312877 [Exophiala viscosa]|uniref:Uncharacterized protein n=1 Tax=Exophiala viscosa TaxID=2486360 RepID=A0AAN6DTX9_9EURO|nr:hypothetical protein EDD36DRAFT_312877 [Exophiala viscosa]
MHLHQCHESSHIQTALRGHDRSHVRAASPHPQCISPLKGFLQTNDFCQVRLLLLLELSCLADPEVRCRKKVVGNYATVVFRIQGHVSRDLKRPWACRLGRPGGIQINQMTTCSSSTHDKRLSIFDGPEPLRKLNEASSTNKGGSLFVVCPKITQHRTRLLRCHSAKQKGGVGSKSKDTRLSRCSLVCHNPNVRWSSMSSVYNRAMSEHCSCNHPGCSFCL